MLPLAALLLAALAPDAGRADGGTADAGVPVTVSADTLTVLSKERSATYQGHAHATQGTATLDADRLTAFYGPTQNVERLEASGALHFVDGDRSARAEAATYDPRTGELFVPGAVLASAGNRKVRGASARYQKATSVLTVTSPVAAFGAEALPVAGSGEATVEANTLRFEQDAKAAVFQGKVRARRGTTLLTAPTLVAHYDEAGTLVRAEATGGVTVVDKDRQAQGARGEWDALSGVLVITGKPVARQGSQTLSGSRVTFRPGSDTLEVEHATAVLKSP